MRPLEAHGFKNIEMMREWMLPAAIFSDACNLLRKRLPSTEMERVEVSTAPRIFLFSGEGAHSPETDTATQL